MTNLELSVFFPWMDKQEQPTFLESFIESPFPASTNTY